MAFGAQAFGNWGCLPKYYKDVLGLVLKGAIQNKPFVKHYPMSEINEIFQKSHDGVLKERPILIPDFKN
jgi:6-hydroxycyclohex-1-ene-1-carbonyl-CoA dehydrogenase